jgi:hypothetical protein
MIEGFEPDPTDPSDPSLALNNNDDIKNIRSAPQATAAAIGAVGASPAAAPVGGGGGEGKGGCFVLGALSQPPLPALPTHLEVGGMLSTINPKPTAYAVPCPPNFPFSF